MSVLVGLTGPQVVAVLGLCALLTYAGIKAWGDR